MVRIYLVVSLLVKQLGHAVGSASHLSIVECIP